MQATFAFTMQQDQPQHLRWVSWNGADCVLQDATVQLEQPMKYLAQEAHTGKAFLVFAVLE